MDQMPDEAQAAVRTVARATAGYEGTIEDVYRRYRRRSRRRAVVSTLSALALLAGIGVAVQQGTTLRRTGDQPAAPVAAIPSPPPVQRLLLPPRLEGTYSAPDDTTVELDDSVVAELTPTGQVVKHPFVGQEMWSTVVGLPSGDLVAAGGSELTVVGADGTVVAKRKISVTPSVLVGADETNAYFWHGEVLRELRLADGTQRERWSEPGIGSLMAANVVGDRLAIATRENPCQTRVLSLGDGSRVGGSAMPLDNCTRIVMVRLSPDGLKLAVGYESPGGRRRVVVERVGSPEQLVSPYQIGATKSASVIVAAWRDDTTVTAVDVTEDRQLRPLTIKVPS